MTRGGVSEDPGGQLLRGTTGWPLVTGWLVVVVVVPCFPSPLLALLASLHLTRLDYSPSFPPSDYSFPVVDSYSHLVSFPSFPPYDFFFPYYFVFPLSFICFLFSFVSFLPFIFFVFLSCFVSSTIPRVGRRTDTDGNGWDTDVHEGFHCVCVFCRLHLLHCLKGSYQRG